jgi:hypothetical protein
MTELRTPVRAAAFLAALAVVLVAALGIGRLVGPVDVQASDERGSTGHDAGESAAGAVAHDDHGGGIGLGLTQERGDYRLELPATRLAAGEQTLAFTVVGPEGPLTAYDEAHERDLHLIVVRRDLTGFQHVHPALDGATGEWSVDLVLEPGSWRLLADFVPAGGDQHVLGADVVVDGAGTVEPIGEDVLGVSVDGYDVTLGLDPEVGVETPVVATIMKDGREVTDLGQYLGELGHLVVLRDGDLGYVHGHPGETAASGPTIPFAVTFPSGGRYRLFLEFEHGGEVHTAAFTVGVEAGDGHTHDHGDESGEHGSDEHESGEHGSAEPEEDEDHGH